ncbi:helical backbone metal receptor [Azoarcus taiwanensis]|uniref:ABC transporter substrate-binding protein n=1 Tax=Azoarcus taiwanensis TaxID=666964 RepID=A0A972F9E7_9RHOO|nr:helical backbone metal receptor [Azoarcus taiwanensis]NMG04250.1 ABC transporter substrate-binding protein [Azoarcus taiwanensis]
MQNETKNASDDLEPLVDAAGTTHEAVAAGEARIVSLVPSLTELLCDLGLAPQLVGRTGFCIHPREVVRSIPKVGGTKDVRLDRLRELAPTHVVLNIDENTRDTAQALVDVVPHVIVTHPCAPEDNAALYSLFGGIFGREQEAARLSSGLADALTEAASLRVRVEEERVLYLIWREPWMTVSHQTYIASMLERVGWICLPDVHEPRYPSFEWDAEWLTDVQRVFLSSEPYRFRERHLGEVSSLSGRPASLINGEMVSWYGSRAIAGLRYLTALRAELAGLPATVPALPRV